MGAVFVDPAGVEWFEVARKKFVAAEDYADAIRQHEEYGFGWTIGRLDEIGCGPLYFERFENRPKRGRT